MDLKSKYKEQLLSFIPVVSAMEVDIIDIGMRQIKLSAPLNTNINYEGTAFGGSLNTLCILSGYLLVHHLMISNGLEIDSLVIQDSQIKYKKPVNKNFFATATVDEEEMNRFFKLLKRKNTGRIKIQSSISISSSTGVGANISSPLVDFSARFVASAKPKSI